MEIVAKESHPNKWLVRIPEVFAELETDIFQSLGARPLKKLGLEYRLIQLENPAAIQHSDASKYLRWNLPIHHSWPCNPKETPGFIEKAAQALYRKFFPANPQAILIGPIDPGASNPYYRTLASNLRGRTLQLFPPDIGANHDAEKQDSGKPTLFCLLGKEGLFCGVQSPLASNGFYPGGTKYIRQNSADTISRAGAKIAEALHHLHLHREPPPEGSHWLELGASPGGMTAELLARNYQVTAVDRAPLDKRLHQARNLTSVIADAATFQPQKNTTFAAVLSDMNGDALQSITQVIRLSKHLAKNGLVVFTLKLPGVSNFAEANELETIVVNAASAAGLLLFSKTHLTYNRNEFTLFFKLGAKSQKLPIDSPPEHDSGFNDT